MVKFKAFGTQRPNEMARDKKMYYPSQIKGIGYSSQKQLQKMKMNNLKRVNKSRLAKASFLKGLGLTKLSRLAAVRNVKMKKNELKRLKKKVYNQNYKRSLR